MSSGCASKFASECRAPESRQPQRDGSETAQGGPKQQTLADAAVRGGRAHTERAVCPGAKMQRKLADKNSTALHTTATDGSHHPATTTASSRTSWGFVTRTQTMKQKGLQPGGGCGQACHLDLEACTGKGEFEAVIMALRNSSVGTRSISWWMHCTGLRRAIKSWHKGPTIMSPPSTRNCNSSFTHSVNGSEC